MARANARSRKKTAETDAGDLTRQWICNLGAVLDSGRLVAQSAPSILDWDTGLSLSDALPDYPVFSPAISTGPTLPYLDRTIDVVAVAGDDADLLAEARRVAKQCVLQFGLDETERGIAIRPTWVGEAEAATDSVSILIPAYNSVEHVVACLLALEGTMPTGLDVEVIVVDDASDDETFEAIEFCAARNPRIRSIRNDKNLGFIGTCQVASTFATGEILVFLNHDTMPLPGWLPALVSTFRTHERVGAVGAKLLYPDGRLQEAGGVVFRDGTCANFGRGLDPLDPLACFVREVDYCSGAALATRRSLFEELGGFDERYRPAYYEDTDYCMRVWQRGLRVLVQPASCVVHDEGSVHGTDPASGGKRHQARNRHAFARKWAEALKDHPVPPERYTLQAWHDLAIRERSR